MFRALGNGNDRPDRARAIDAIAATLGRSLSPLCTLLNPAAIVLDTSLGEHSSRVRDGITDSLRVTTSPVAIENLHIVAGRLDDAEILGGPALARSAGRRQQR